MPTIPSNTSHANSLPAISRPLISKSPEDFFCVMSRFRIESGHSILHTVGSRASFPGNQPPPTPSPEASTHPRNSGSPMTNSFAVVGSRAASLSSVLQSRKACFADGKSRHRTIFGFTCKIRLIGVIKLMPAGTGVAACRIFPMSFSTRLNGTPFVIRMILWSSSSIATCLSRANSMHRVAPSTIQPSTSFRTAHCPSPSASFFSEIGS